MPTPWSRAGWLASSGTMPRMPTVSADWRASKVATRSDGTRAVGQIVEALDVAVLERLGC